MRNRLSYFALSGLLMILVVSSFLAASVSAEGLQPWSSTKAYPIHLYLVRCVSYSSEIFCIGGNNGTNDIDSVYYAQQSSAGVASWIPSTSYPTTIEYAACVAVYGNVFCVGGHNSSAYFNEVYHSPISLGGGLGSWLPTTSYPNYGYGQSCVTDSGYIYCVGGYNGGFTNAVYYAGINPGGVEAWQATTSYPFKVSFQNCVVYSGDIYCIAGDDNGVTGVNSTDYAYYAPLTAAGVGAWQRTTNYPLNIIDEECVVNSGFVYCIGGYSGGTLDVGQHPDVYYAPLSSTGIGSWHATSPYPAPVVGHSCVSDVIHVYCIAGSTNILDNVVYYSQFLTPTNTTVSCSKNNVSFDATVSCTAIVKGSNATGSVEWHANATSTFNSSSCALISGSCSVTYTASESGVTMIVANYSGDSINSPSSGAFILHVSSSNSLTSTGTNRGTSSFSSRPCSSCGFRASPLIVLLSVIVVLAVITGLAVILRRRHALS